MLNVQTPLLTDDELERLPDNSPILTGLWLQAFLSGQLETRKDGALAIRRVLIFNTKARHVKIDPEGPWHSR